MKLRNWLIMSGAVIVGIMVLIAACDMSAMLGLNEEETESHPTRIESFRIEASKNEGLSQDAVGLISGTDIFITLPYALIAGNAVLEPTIKVPSYISISPTGPVIMSGNPQYELVNSKASGGDRTVFTVRASVDTGSLTVVSVANPFWRDADGTEHELDGAEIEAVDGAFIVKTDYTTFQQLEGKAIGFRNVNYAPGTGGENLLRPLAGATTPYSITVVSSDGTGIKEYVFTRGFQTEEGAGIMTFADARPVYDTVLHKRLDTSTWDTFASQTVPLGSHGSYPISLAWTGAGPAVGGLNWSNALMASAMSGRTFTTSCRWGDRGAIREGSVSLRATHNSSISRNVLRDAGAIDDFNEVNNGNVGSRSGEAERGSVTRVMIDSIWENRAELPNAANVNVNNVTQSWSWRYRLREQRSADLQVRYTYCYEDDDSYRWRQVETNGSTNYFWGIPHWSASHTVTTPFSPAQMWSAPQWEEKEFVPRDYYSIESLRVEPALGAKVVGVQVFGIGLSYEILEDGALAVIEIEDFGTERTYGFVGLVEVEAQSGDREMHILNIL